MSKAPSWIDIKSLPKRDIYICFGLTKSSTKTMLEIPYEHIFRQTYQGSGLRRGLGNTGKICHFFSAIDFLAQVHKV